jgi:hypothetical protein
LQAHEQKSYLLHISQAFQSLVKAAVDGTYNEPFFGDAKTDDGYQKRIRAFIQNPNEKFTDNISHRGYFRHVLESEDHRSVSKRQVLLTKKEYIQHIKTLLKKTRGREPPGTFNPLIVKDLFEEQCGPWEDLTHDHITAAWTAAREFFQHAVSYVADEATSKALFQKVILPPLENLRHALRKGNGELLMPHQRGHPITYNHYFTETLRKARADRQKEAFRKVLRRSDQRLLVIKIIVGFTIDWHRG